MVILKLALLTAAFKPAGRICHTIIPISAVYFMLLFNQLNRTMAHPYFLNFTSVITLHLRNKLPRKDKRLSRPGWLTYSGRFTHVSGRPSHQLHVEGRTGKVRQRRSHRILPVHHFTGH